MNTFGEINWTDDVVGGNEGGKKNTKDLWLRLHNGSNQVRLVTQPFQYMVHKYKKDPENPKDFGRKIKCSAIHGSCPLCDTGDKPKQRWLLGVISRPDNTFKILDVSWMIFNAIRKLAKNTQHFGDPTKYDIIIEVDEAGGASGYYQVQALSKEPLNATDQVTKDKIDMDELKRQVTPPTAEVVNKIIAKINGDTVPAPAPATNGKKAAPKTAAAPAVSMTDDEELDKLFPSHEGDAAQS